MKNEMISEDFGASILPRGIYKRLQKKAEKEKCSFSEILLEASLAYLESDGEMNRSYKQGYEDGKLAGSYDQGYDAGWNDAWDELRDRVNFAFLDVK